jgi:hypothetical protein
MNALVVFFYFECLEVYKLEYSSTFQKLVFNQRCLESFILQLQLSQSESINPGSSGLHIPWRILEIETRVVIHSKEYMKKLEGNKITYR